MTMISEGELARAEVILARAAKAFDVTMEVLDAAVDRLRAQEDVAPTEIKKDLKEMNNALLLALSMEEKARAARGEQEQGGPGRFDLDAARAEIRCRLACLRDARAGGDVSGGAE